MINVGRYVLSDNDKRTYSTQLADYECVEGDRTKLLTQVRENEEFCRDQKAISYDYFIQSLSQYSCIYIENESGKILGACSIGLGVYIIVYAICVPVGGPGIGTLLLNNVKSIGKVIGAVSIGLSADTSVYKFYERNGFTVTDTKYDSDSEPDTPSESDEPSERRSATRTKKISGYGMTYNLKRTGGRKYHTKNKKNKKKTSRKYNRRF